MSTQQHRGFMIGSMVEIILPIILCLMSDFLSARSFRCGHYCPRPTFLLQLMVSIQRHDIIKSKD